jgi:putative zinc finger/helix-turn-helix YgiT family protein
MHNKGSKSPTIVTRKCYECGGLMEGRRGREYDYKECGLHKVRLVNILVFTCQNPECGSVVPEIPNIGELHTRIALSLIKKKTLLTGEEIRFLRNMANLSAIELSKMLGIHHTALSRWENNARNISKKTDVALRLLCFAAIIQERLSSNDVMDRVLDAAKTISEIDMKSILKRVQEIMSGSALVRIDPKSLSHLGCSEQIDVGGIVSASPVLQ